MRNPSRIYPLLNKIGDIWIRYPDLRLCQLINVINGENPKDPSNFNLEDFVFEENIKGFLKEEKKRKIR